MGLVATTRPASRQVSLCMFVIWGETGRTSNKDTWVWLRQRGFAPQTGELMYVCWMTLSSSAKADVSLFAFWRVVSTAAARWLTRIFARCVWWNWICHENLHKCRRPASFGRQAARDFDVRSSGKRRSRTGLVSLHKLACHAGNPYKT